MKSIFIAALVLTLTSSIASAQAHRLEFYGDEALTSCDLAMTTPGLVKVHMLVTGPGNVGAISFKAPKPACMGDATWISDIWTVPPMYGYAGNTQATGAYQGVDVVFGCQPLPLYIGWIWYSVTSPAQTCCLYAPQSGSSNGNIPFPGSMTIDLYIDCAHAAQETPVEAPMSGKGITINANETCACNLPVPTRPSTWGGVKALYR